MGGRSRYDTNDMNSRTTRLFGALRDRTQASCCGGLHDEMFQLALPMLIEGGTGGPLRAIAVVP
jgi:hypothetical protein